MLYLFWEKDEERSCVESRDREFETKDDGILEGMPIDQMVRSVLEDYNLMRGGETAWVGSVKCELLSGKIIPASFIPRRA